MSLMTLQKQLVGEILLPLTLADWVWGWDGLVFEVLSFISFYLLSIFHNNAV